MAKKKIHTTPVTECRYPFLDRPDTQFNKDGVYRIDLVFDPEDEFVVGLEKASQQEFEKAKKDMKPVDRKKVQYESPVKPILDPETGDETGQVVVKFKTYATFTDKQGNKKKITIPIYDAKGKPLKQMPKIGNGSRVSVAFTARPQVVTGSFFYTLYFDAVQLVELVEFNPDGSSYGFGKYDDGFDADDFDASEPGSTEPDDDYQPF